MIIISWLSQLPQKLTRITSGGKIIKEIDGLRFLAIFPVVLQHLAERVSRQDHTHYISSVSEDLIFHTLSHGSIGVYIFFTISGFILAMPFASHNIDQTREVKLGDYYLRRVTRLEPPYIVWTTLFFFLYIIVKHADLKDTFPHYLASLFYLHGIFYQMWSPINPPTWTLEIEIQFYILAPFLANILFSVSKNKITRRLLILGIIIAIMLTQQFIDQFQKAFMMLSILGQLQYFMLGFIMADIFLCEWKTGITKHRIYDFIAVISFFTLIYSWDWDFKLINRTIFMIALFVLFYSVFKSIAVNKFVTNRWITAIGGMCYTIYLTHLPLTEFFMKLSKHIHVSDYFSVNYLIQLLLFIPFIMTTSIIGFLLLEKPCMDKDWPTKLKNFLFNRTAIKKA